MRYKNLQRALTASVLAVGVSAGTIQNVSAQPAAPVEVTANQNMVTVNIEGIQIPGLPANQLKMPILPGLDSVLREGPRYARQLDSLMKQINELISDQKSALRDLTAPERKLTNARNNVHIAEQEHGKRSDEYKSAREEFKNVRNEIRDQAKGGDKEARAAISDRKSQNKQRDASAIRILVARDRLELTIERNGGSEGEGSREPAVQDGNLRPTNYVEAAERKSEENRQRQQKDNGDDREDRREQPQQREEPSQDEIEKKQRAERYEERAASVYSPENPEESALYAFGHYQNPIGVPSLVKPEDKEGYGDLARMNLRTAVDKALRKSTDLKESVAKLRKAESEGDEMKMGEAREELRPLIDAVGKALYNWDDEYPMDSKEAKTIIGEGATPYDLADNPEDQEKFDQFIVDFLTIPSKFARYVENNNKKAQREQVNQDQEESEDQQY